MAPRTAGRAIVDVLEAEGVDHVCGPEVYAAIHRASATWDGSDPIRRTDR